MGHGAKDNRRALIDTVKDCIAQTNAMTGLATVVREAHNNLSTEVDASVRLLTTRCDAQIALIKGSEADISRIKKHDTVTRELATAARADHVAFVGMTFWQRLRWVFTGTLPAAAAQQALSKKRILEVLGGEPTPQTIARVPQPHQPARMSAGMAPRPLP